MPCLPTPVCVRLSTLLCPALPSLPQLRPFALKALKTSCTLVHAGPSKLASPIAGRPSVRPSLTWTSVPSLHSGCAPGPQHSLPRARSPLVTWHSPC